MQLLTDKTSIPALVMGLLCADFDSRSWFYAPETITVNRTMNSGLADKGHPVEALVFEPAQGKFKDKYKFCVYFSPSEAEQHPQVMVTVHLVGIDLEKQRIGFHTKFDHSIADIPGLSFQIMQWLLERSDLFTTKSSVEAGLFSSYKNNLPVEVLMANSKKAAQNSLLINS